MNDTEVRLRAARDALDREDGAPAAILPTLTPATAITPVAVTWLWDGWLAAGKVHVLAGPPGVGKTTLAIAIAAAVSSGGTFPDGTQAKAGTVVIWSGEDDPADTLVPRLLANGADLSRVHFVGARTDGSPFDPARDMPALKDVIAKLPEPPTLLLLDPLVSAVAGDSHKNAEVRRSLQPIADLAAATGCAVLGITHYAKGTKGQDPVERVCGSVAFGAVARLVWGAAKLPDDHPDGPGRVLVRAKSNLGEDSGGFRFELTQVPVPDRPLIMASRVIWKGAITGQARDILADAETYTDPEDRTAIDDAVDWLWDTLQTGPLAGTIILDLAKKADHSRRTLYRARGKLKVDSKSDGYGKSWIWSLPCVPSVPTSVTTEYGGTHGVVGTHEADLSPICAKDPMCASDFRGEPAGTHGTHDGVTVPPRDPLKDHL